MPKKTVDFTVVDAFVVNNERFTGNPAAVITLDRDCEISDPKKQQIAAEFNLSETVFVSKLNDSDRRLIRWFTPTKEVNLCGHATVAASYVLFHKNPALRTIKYITRSDMKLECRRDDDWKLTLDFPTNAPKKLLPAEAAWLPQLTKAVLGPELATRVVDYQLSPGTKKLLLRLDDKVHHDDLTTITPNINDMLAIDNGNEVWGVIVTQRSNYAETKLHFRSRYFAPWAGINEDPVTGSSFTVLTPYWTQAYLAEPEERERPMLRREMDDAVYCSRVPQPFRSLQASKRGGIVESRVVGDRVFISGSAVKTISGVLEYQGTDKVPLLPNPEE